MTHAQKREMRRLSTRELDARNRFLAANANANAAEEQARHLRAVANDRLAELVGVRFPSVARILRGGTKGRKA